MYTTPLSFAFNSSFPLSSLFINPPKNLHLPKINPQISLLTITTSSIEKVMEYLEDDLFFADLSKQISLLIMDDDEVPISPYPGVSFQDLSRGSYPISRASSPFMVEQQSCRRESKGTGVFIPRSSQPRRKNRTGRHSSNSLNNKSPRQLDNNTRTSNSNHVSSNYTTTSLYPKQA